MRFTKATTAIVGLLLAGASAPQPTSPPPVDRDPLRRIAAALERPSPQTAPDVGCKPSKEDRSSSLCSQWKSADAASDAARSADRQLAVAWIGLGLGLITMLAAIAVALFARRAAVATEETVRLGNDTARRQLRAYLGIHPLEMEALALEPGPFPLLTYTVENFGATPVRNWSIRITWEVTNKEPTAAFFDERTANGPEGEWQHSFPPHSVKQMHWPIEISQHYKSMVISDDHQLFVMGKIFYEDVFGEHHQTEFFYRYNVGLRTKFGQVKCRNSMT